MVVRSSLKALEKMPRLENKKKAKKSWWKKLSSFLSAQDLAMVCGALVVVYLITGDSAELVCDVFTSLPAAVFTYQLVTNKEATRAAYEATLCFWILHGTLVVFDHLLYKTVWYFFVKFLLMAAVSTHVLTKIKHEKSKPPAISSNDAYESAKDVHQQIESDKPTPRFQSFSEKCISSMPTTKDIASPGTQMRSIATQTVVGRAKPKEFCLYDGPRNGRVFRRNLAPIAEDSISSRIYEARAAAGGPMSPKGDNNGNMLSMDWFLPKGVDMAQSANDASSPKAVQDSVASTTGKILLFGQQDALSKQMIVFEEPFEEVVSVALANSTKKNIIWALKTNAHGRILATPTCGLLPKDQMIDVSMSIQQVDDAINLAKVKDDRMVFEYAYVPDTCDAFDSLWLTKKNSEKTRKVLAVVYRQ